MNRAQRRAAKRNAALSTGPRTPEGKAASSRNAIKHNLSGSTFVLLPGEDESAFRALVHEYTDEWKPGTPHETFLVAQMVQARWRLNRIARMEAVVIDAMLEGFGDGRSDEGAIVVAENQNPDPLRRLHRYAQDAERSYNRAVRELRTYRAEARKAAPQSMKSVERAAVPEPKNSAPSTTYEKLQNEPKWICDSPTVAAPAATRHSPLVTPSVHAPC